MKNIKQQFPIFKNHPDMVYLDSAASSQTCQATLDAMNEYYTNYRANIHRGVYPLSEQATKAYEQAREQVANFIGADTDEVVFTKGTTESLNLLANSLTKDLGPGDNVVLTRLEHHANLVPWLEASKRQGFEVRYIELNKEDEISIDESSIKKVIDTNTKVIAFAHVSNVLGLTLPVATIVKAAKAVGATTVLDAAQSVPHMPINVRELDVDFIGFSGHKMYGPIGIGVLYGKKEKLNTLDPLLYGGDMIREVRYDGATYADAPARFEAGTPPIAEAIGFGAAVTWLSSLGMGDVLAHSQQMTAILVEQLERVEGVTVLKSADQLASVSFTVDGAHPHDMADLLGNRSVAVRAGHHCAMPLMGYLGVNATLRASVGVYTSEDDVKNLLKQLQEVIEILT